MAEIGHNSALDGVQISKDQLKSFVDRIERLAAEKDGIQADITDLYGELKSLGYDAKVVRRIVALRKIKPNQRREMQELLEIYAMALDTEGVFQ